MGEQPPRDIATSVLTQTREARSPKYRLTVVEGRDVGAAVEGGADELSIGTAAGNGLVLADDTVSRHHIALSATSRGLRLRDLGSTNGTVVNGVAVEAAYVTPGATIQIGKTRLRVDRVDGDELTALAAATQWGSALGTSQAMRRIFAALPRLAASDATILIEGETGTGKSLLAHAIHDGGARAAGPFTVIDCSAIPPNLIESELFGHEKGAFTGASAARAGAFEAARGGTVFLDEVGELALDMQPKLLRALEERRIKRVGGSAAVPLEIRVIAATNRDLRAEVNRGRFRTDLYYRLNTVRLYVPPLRERPDDIPQLVGHFYRQFSPTDPEPPAELMASWMRNEWPGNVRELRSAIERSVLLGDPAVWDALSESPREAPDSRSGASSARPVDGESFRVAKERAVAEWEREYLRALIAEHHGNISSAARAVRMDRNHLRELLLRHQIEVV